MISRFLDWVFPSRVEKRRRKKIEDKMRQDRINAYTHREVLRKLERKEREQRMWNVAREATLPKPTRPAPPMPATKPSRQYGESRGGEETVWSSPTGQFSEPFYDNDSAKPEPEPFRGNGGTFDGGGASGDWQDDSSRTSTSCDAPSYSPSESSSSSSSDSGSSSYDGGGSSDSSSFCGGD